MNEEPAPSSREYLLRQKWLTMSDEHGWFVATLREHQLKPPNPKNLEVIVATHEEFWARHICDVHNSFAERYSAIQDAKPSNVTNIRREE